MKTPIQKKSTKKKKIKKKSKKKKKYQYILASLASHKIHNIYKIYQCKYTIANGNWEVLQVVYNHFALFDKMLNSNIS